MTARGGLGAKTRLPRDVVDGQIRYVRRRYLTRDTAQAVAIGVANATSAARQ